MTYTQAKLIIWNPDAYTREQVREAAVFILASLHVSQEDTDQAAAVVRDPSGYYRESAAHKADRERAETWDEKHARLSRTPGEQAWAESRGDDLGESPDF